MFISRQKKLLFVHIQKTGGSSIAKVLSQKVPDAKSMLGIHDHALWARGALGTEYSELFKFAFVRNPWDRLVSWYTMIEQRREMLPWSQLNQLWRYVLTHSTSFEEFVSNCTATIDDIDGRKGFLYNQLDYITDESGRLIVDFVGRYENFERDVKEVFSALELDDVEVPHTNKSKRGHYSEYYSKTTEEIVAERYSKDIAFFGYAFDASAQ
jgi:hypothetical protein